MLCIVWCLGVFGLIWCLVCGLVLECFVMPWNVCCLVWLLSCCCLFMIGAFGVCFGMLVFAMLILFVGIGLFEVFCLVCGYDRLVYYWFCVRLIGGVDWCCISGFHVRMVLLACIWWLGGCAVLCLLTWLYVLWFWFVLTWRDDWWVLLVVIYVYGYLRMLVGFIIK